MCVHVSITWSVPKAANKVNTTDITNKINAFCLSVRAIRGSVTVFVVDSSSSSLSTVSMVAGNVLCLTSVNRLNRSPLATVACLTALTLGSTSLLAESKEAV